MEFQLESIASFEEFVKKLGHVLDQLVLEMELPEHSLLIRDNEGKTVTTFSICVNEPPYPMLSADKGREFSCTSLLNIQKPKQRGADYAMLKIAPWLHARVAPPPATVAELKEPRDGNPYYLVRVPLELDSACRYVKDLIVERMRIYSTKESPFGCCSLFEACSDARKCLHENKLYSTACSYRHNLEHGRIFYGKNKMV